MPLPAGVRGGNSERHLDLGHFLHVGSPTAFQQPFQETHFSFQQEMKLWETLRTVPASRDIQDLMWSQQLSPSEDTELVEVTHICAVSPLRNGVECLKSEKGSVHQAFQMTCSLLSTYPTQMAWALGTSSSSRTEAVRSQRRGGE